MCPSVVLAMPTYPHIERYYEHKQQLIDFGGSDSEMNVRPAFQNCLDAYCRQHCEKLVLVPELRTSSGTIPDGTVKDSLHLARVCDGAMILAFLVPLFVGLMMSRADIEWGPHDYPVVS